MPGLPAKNEYLVIARKYRPKCFSEVLGQDAIVSTLKNGIKLKRLAHAYLFSGPRGTGKTTLARLLAKAINCQNPTPEFDPCNACSSCKDIGLGNSLDVIEIDGASNRGIDDIRQINETVGYSTASGKYKIYIIDEVHMLTKEAFNALLKTLEEPPSTVKFFFATTEPHKVPPTVLSRCQQFQLRHLSSSLITNKLASIAKDQNREVEQAALMMIATKAEGGLRDAESLLDQLLSFYDGNILASHAADALGMLSLDAFFKLDKAANEGNLAFAFEITAQIFSEGKDPIRFVETLIEHYRRLVLIKLAGINSPCLELAKELKTPYNDSAQFYQKHQLLTILDLCLEASSTLRFASSPRIALEGLLLKILRSYAKIPLDQLVERLLDLEKRIQGEPSEQALPPKLEVKAQETKPQSIQAEVKQEPDQTKPLVEKVNTPQVINVPQVQHVQEMLEFAKPQVITPTPAPEAIQKALPSVDALRKPSPINEDPTPKPSELPRQKKVQVQAAAPVAPATPAPPTPAALVHRYDTILQFAAVELEGKIIKT